MGVRSRQSVGWGVTADEHEVAVWADGNVLEVAGAKGCKTWRLCGRH